MFILIKNSEYLNFMIGCPGIRMISKNSNNTNQSKNCTGSAKQPRPAKRRGLFNLIPQTFSIKERRS